MYLRLSRFSVIQREELTTSSFETSVAVKVGFDLSFYISPNLCLLLLCM